MYDSEIVMGAIKEEYIRTDKPVNMSFINSRMKHKFGFMKMRKIYNYLVKSGRITIENWKIIPVLTDDDLATMENMDKNKIPVSLDLVRECVKKFYMEHTSYPTPSDIERMFIKTFGIPNIKDFTRLLRKYAENGKIMRTDDHRYYFKFNTLQSGLNAFV